MNLLKIRQYLSITIYEQKLLPVTYSILPAIPKIDLFQTTSFTSNDTNEIPIYHTTKIYIPLYKTYKNHH